MKTRAKVIFNSMLILAGAALFAEQATVQEPAAIKTEISADDQADVISSVTAAEKWLNLVDNGNYHDSWETAAVTFKLKIPEASWTTILDTTRKPLGNITNRKILEQKPAFDPQGLPKGKYMVIFYETSFSTKPKGNELVTLMKLDDGTWKVLTYLVK